ncbi:acyl-CoA dehydrogenase [Halioxenophilus aromaticivorans]|uniref:Acyl-CoA dehydrogenase n=1 Tax=Halioxenophilus aromaticivorans TaxID=1306992 RepID=A0AAV3U653_9ALTE
MSQNNEEFNSELTLIHDQAMKLLQDQVTPEHLKQLLEQPGSFDEKLWQTAVELGWPLLSAPERFGGLGMDLDGLVTLTEILGQKTASLPLISAFVALDAITHCGAEHLPTEQANAIASGAAKVCLALAEPEESGIPSMPNTAMAHGKLNGIKAISAFANVADIALVSATDATQTILVLVDLHQAGVTRTAQPGFDQSRAAASLCFKNASAIPLTEANLDRALGLAALATAFEQIGGAEAAMLMARDYALERHVFNQPIGRFQAIKHKIADMYWRIELARGCALDALQSFQAGASSWLGSSAAARIAATAAYEFTAQENIETHAGIGTTWEGMPQHYYRRSRALALELGSIHSWRNRLIHQTHIAQPAFQEPALQEALGTSEELYQYRLQARAWLAQHAPDYSGEVRLGLSPEEDLALGRRWQALKQTSGYAAINLPAKWGGGGKTELHKIIFGEEELRYQLPTEYFVISTAQIMAIFLRYAPERQREELGPRAICGDDIWCQMFSEPAAGSDLAAVRLKATAATRNAVDGWVLSGQKLWTSWAHISKYGFVVARTDPSVVKHKGISTFYVDMNTPGITVRPIRRMAGQNDVNEVFFDDVFIPDSQRLGPVNKGFNVAMEMLMVERIAGVYDESIGGVSLPELIKLAHRSRIDGQPAIEDGQVRAALAQGYIERLGLRNIYRRAMAAIENGKEPGPEGSIRKLILGRARQQQGALALDLMGAQGAYMNPQGDFRTDFAWSWIDPAARIAGGTDEVLLSTIGERVLGLPQDHRPDKNVPFNQL